MLSFLQKRKNIILIPSFGILLFLILYYFATLYYGGGNNFNKNQKGFSWIHNYWCNLFDKYSINGNINQSRPIAIIAMGVICVSIFLFWYLFSIILTQNKEKYLLQLSALLSMTLAFFIFIFNHDLVINIATGIGIISLIITYKILYEQKWHWLFYLGVFNLFLIGVNNLFYYSSNLIFYLPVLQKGTFICFLFWIICINIKLFKIQNRVT